MNNNFTEHNSPFLYYTSELLDNYNIVHIFATRFGGVSKSDFSYLNVSTARTDKDGNFDRPENIEENYRIALDLINAIPEKSVAARQTHSSRVIYAQDEFCGKGILQNTVMPQEADGLIIGKDSSRVEAITVKTADCVPIIIANVDSREVAIVHAGWRGTVQNIVGNACEMLLKNGGELVCAIGPHIGKCCYQVGENVRQEAVKLLSGFNIDSDEFFTKCDDDKYYMSLGGINASLLKKYSVKDENIAICRMCTCCTKNTSGEHIFFSHRGMNGHSGTFVSAVKKKII